MTKENPPPTLGRMFGGSLILLAILSLVGWAISPSEVDTAAEELEKTQAAITAQWKEKQALDLKSAQAKADGDRRARIAKCLTTFNALVSDISIIDSTATTSYGELVLVVDDRWYAQPYDTRLQFAQRFGQLWEKCDTEWNADFSIRDRNGKEIGGRGLTGVWVNP